MGQENKRKNLIGEGFEDTVAAILRRVPGVATAYEIQARPLLHTVPGFNPPPPRAKPRKVDLALVRRRDRRRILATAKWSVRADREEQFMSDFTDYSRLENLGQDFDYVLLTNEFDPARVVNACERRRENAVLFTDVVHVNPHGLAVAYNAGEPTSLRAAAADALRHTHTGRLMSLERWVDSLIEQG